ncbi:uncharacterized protein IWZ02DRAFT_156030 [Phyllosticta citriasiana]|uniref:Uncharacterized protein n=1 Tax=Phyllosticta citriasiana TaxID=595635 RepID=A0ABR1K7Y6_9PEZI
MLVFDVATNPESRTCPLLLHVCVCLNCCAPSPPFPSIRRILPPNQDALSLHCPFNRCAGDGQDGLVGFHYGSSRGAASSVRRSALMRGGWRSSVGGPRATAQAVNTTRLTGRRVVQWSLLERDCDRQAAVGTRGQQGAEGVKARDQQCKPSTHEAANRVRPRCKSCRDRRAQLSARPWRTGHGDREDDDVRRG